MRTYRFLELESGEPRHPIETVLEIDVTWEEFKILASPAGAGHVQRSMVLDHCRRVFDEETMTLIELHLAARPTKLPLFKPIEKVVIGARPPVPFYRFDELEELFR